MVYSELSHIGSVKDVKAFFRYLVRERNLPLQPDSLFACYLDAEGNALFDERECALFDRLMDEAFAVCERFNADIYEIGVNTLIP